MNAFELLMSMSADGRLGGRLQQIPNNNALVNKLKSDSSWLSPLLLQNEYKRICDFCGEDKVGWMLHDVSWLTILNKYIVSVNYRSAHLYVLIADSNTCISYKLKHNIWNLNI